MSVFSYGRHGEARKASDVDRPGHKTGDDKNKTSDVGPEGRDHDRVHASSEDTEADSRGGDQQPAATADEIYGAIHDLQNTIEAVAKKISTAANTREQSSLGLNSVWDRFWHAVTSGLFFMAVGCLFLVFAYLTMGGPTYSIFSFVLVVLGVGILLFGTGTQSMGQFSSDVGALKYKIGIAGGAGIAAFCVAYGLVTYYPQMKNAFEIEKRYSRWTRMCVRRVPRRASLSGARRSHGHAWLSGCLFAVC